MMTVTKERSKPAINNDTIKTIKKKPLEDQTATAHKKKGFAYNRLTNNSSYLSQMSIFGGSKEKIISAFSLLS